MFTCRCYRNRVCDKKTGRCPRDECANGFWGEGCQLGVYYVRSSTKVIHLFLRLVYRAALFWFVCLSCFSLAISLKINRIKTTCTYERSRVQVSKGKSSLIEAKGSLYGTLVIGEHEVNFKFQVNLKNLKSNLHLFFKEIT